MSLLGYCTLSLNVSVGLRAELKKLKIAVNASIMFIFKKMLARGEKEINQLLLKFVCSRFAFGFSGPPLFWILFLYIIFS